MANVTYEKDVSALLVIDPYKRFHFRGWQSMGSPERHCRSKSVAFLICCRCWMRRGTRAFACSMRYIDDTALATTRRGSTSRPFRGQLGRQKAFEYGTWGGEIRNEFEPQTGRYRGSSSIGAPVVSLTRIWICNSSGTASISSS